MLKWYVTYTKTHAEQQAAFHLRNQGFNVYLPQYRKTNRHARRVTEVQRPLFPRYLFVELDIGAQAWRAVNGTRGIIHLVTRGETPVPVPEPVMQELRSRETADGTILLTPPDMVPGERLRILDGPLANVVGLFECMIDSQRATLLLELLGRTVRVRTPVHSLSPAS